MELETTDATNAYPFAERPLRATWSSPLSWSFASFAVLCAALAIYLRLPIAIADLDDIVLRTLFPAGLAFTFAFAPSPPTEVGRQARWLTVIALSMSVFSGDYAPLVLASYPLVLVIAVLSAFMLSTQESSGD